MSDLTEKFDKSRQEATGETLEALRQNYFIEAQMRGSDDQSIGGLNINTSGRHNSPHSEDKKRNEKANDTAFLTLLDDIRERLADLEASMAERLKTLQGKYGDNVIGGMVDTFLSDEEKAGLETADKKMKALAKKFLNEDGTIKDKYKNTEEAKYIRDWSEAQKLKPIITKYDGREYLEPHEQQEILDTASSANLASQQYMYLLSQNQQVKETVEQALDDERKGQARYDDGSSFFTFGG